MIAERETLKITLKYEGPDVEDGTMSVEDIVTALQGFASAYGKIASSLDPNVRHQLRITGFERGVERGSANILLEAWKDHA